MRLIEKITELERRVKKNPPIIYSILERNISAGSSAYGSISFKKNFMWTAFVADHIASGADASYPLRKGQVKVNFLDVNRKHNIIRNDFDLDLLASNPNAFGWGPCYRLPIPYLFKRQYTLEYTITNLATFQQDINILLIGHELPEEEAKEPPYLLQFWQFDFGAGETYKEERVGDKDFILYEINTFLPIEISTEYENKLQIYNKSRNESIFQEPIPIGLILSSLAFPYKLPLPYIFEAGSILRVEYIENSSISLIGFYGEAPKRKYKEKEIREEIQACVLIK